VRRKGVAPASQSYPPESRALLGSTTAISILRLSFNACAARLGLCPSCSANLLNACFGLQADASTFVQRAIHGSDGDAKRFCDVVDPQRSSTPSS
jgi:hypothetical protein